jgi:uncharacterized protein (UPF0332 family)
MMDFIKDLLQRGLIREENIGADQVESHIDRALKDIEVAKANMSIDLEASYNYSYLAMLRAGRGLMFSYGLRPCGTEQHKTVVEFCTYVFGNDFPDLVKHFDRMRKKRNRFTYDEPGLLVTETETLNAVKDAEIFVQKTSEFILKSLKKKKGFQ